MAAAMGVGAAGKPAKLNTLEKSKLDWTSCVPPSPSPPLPSPPSFLPFVFPRSASARLEESAVADVSLPPPPLASTSSMHLLRAPFPPSLTPKRNPKPKPKPPTKTNETQRRYVSSETGLEDSLAHARKDGYLDRRDFLDRVEGKKSEQFDQARQASRRGPGAAGGKR